jgi:hypothetical protein
MPDYMILDTVLSQFARNNVMKVKKPRLEIKAAPTKIQIAYALKSTGSISEILRPRLASSWLAHVIFGRGFGNSNTDIFEIKNSNLLHVGSLRNSWPNIRTNPLLADEEDRLELFRQIMLSQLGYQSYRRDLIIAALSQIQGSGLINKIFNWTWFSLEWFLRGLEKVRNPRGPLEVYVGEFGGNRKKVSRLYSDVYKTHLESFVTSLKSNYTEIDGSFDEIDRDVSSAKTKTGIEAFHPSVLELFDRHSAYLQRSVMENVPNISNDDEKQQINYWLDNWDVMKSLVAKARDARHPMFHEGEYNGLLAGPNKFTNLRELIAFVSVVLSMILTRPPIEYDKDARKVELLDLPQEREIVQFMPKDKHGHLSWVSLDNGKRVSKQLKITSFSTDSELKMAEIINYEGIFKLESRSGSIAQVRPSVDALYTLETDECVLRLEFSELEPLRFKIVQWYKK